MKTCSSWDGPKQKGQRLMNAHMSEKLIKKNLSK
jgi:hypothetical protein